MASYTIPNSATAKGKAPATDLDQHNGASSSVDHSREQSGLFMSPAPEVANSYMSRLIASDRRRPSEQMADLQAAQAAKRARTDAPTTSQIAGPPRPSIEDVEDEDEAQTHQSDQNAHNAANIQRRDQTASTMNAAGAEVEKTSSRIVKAPPQVSRNTQSEQPVTQAGSSVRPASAAVDLTGSDDEEHEGNGVPQGHRILRRTEITATSNEFGKAIRARCHKMCEAAATTLSRRTDEEGKQIFLRCVGTATLLKGAKTLANLRKIMIDDVKDVLADANTTLSKRRDKYNKYFEGEDDVLQKIDLKKILDRQDARVEKIEKARNFRKDLVYDLRDLSPAFLRRGI